MRRVCGHSLGFIAVSGTCLVVHNLVLIAGSAQGLSLIAALAVSFAIVVVIGYLGHCLVTFREDLNASGFMRYAIAMAANLPAAFVTIWLANKALGLQMIVAAPLSTVVSLGLNYALSHWAIKGRRPMGDAPQ